MKSLHWIHSDKLCELHWSVKVVCIAFRCIDIQSDCCDTKVGLSEKSKKWGDDWWWFSTTHGAPFGGNKQWDLTFLWQHMSCLNVCHLWFKWNNSISWHCVNFHFYVTSHQNCIKPKQCSRIGMFLTARHKKSVSLISLKMWHSIS